MKLYEITGEILELLTMAEDLELDQKMIQDTMEGLDFEFEEKAEAYAKVVKTLEMDIAGLDEEIQRMTKRKATIKNNIDRLKRSLEGAMIATGKRKFKTPLFGFGIQKNPPSLNVLDETKIPEEFWIEQQPKLDKKAALAYVKENKVDWAELSQTESLRIR